MYPDFFMSISHSISAVVITKNEERNIRRCLLSLQKVCDEIIIVDSYSTDKTEEIAKEFNCQFVQHQWLGYAATKNFGNALASSDYILSLDADEELSTELLASIKELKQESALYICSLNRLTNYCGTWIKYAGWYPDKKIRLFPKGSCVWQGDFVHETIKILKPFAARHLSGDLLHYSYYTKTEHIIRENSYARLAAQRDQNKSYSKMGSYLSALSKFIKMYLIKAGFLHGQKGLQLCRIAANGKLVKYRIWKKLNT